MLPGGLHGAPIHLIPQTVIPIDRSQCNATVSTPPPRPTPTPSPTGPSPHAQTCQALQNVATNAIIPCHTSLSCSAIDCNATVANGQYYPSRVIILPCNNPPAVEVILWGPDGEVLQDEILTESRTQPVLYHGFPLFDVVVNIRHVTTPQDAIILKVSVCELGLFSL